MVEVVLYSTATYWKVCQIFCHPVMSPSFRPTQLVSMTVHWTCTRVEEPCCTMTSLFWPTSPASTAAPGSPTKACDISIALMWVCVGKRWEAAVLMTFLFVKMYFHLRFNPLCFSCRAGHWPPVWTMWQRARDRSKVTSASPLWFPLISGVRVWCRHSLSLLVTNSLVWIDYWGIQYCKLEDALLFYSI